MRLPVVILLLFQFGCAFGAWADDAVDRDNRMVTLSDGWQLYAGKLVAPLDAPGLAGAEPVTAPHIWQNMSDEGPDGAYGVATYVRHVTLAGPGYDFALIPAKIRMVYHYYAVVSDPVTGARRVHDMGGNGNPGVDAENNTHAPPRDMVFGFPEREFDLVIQVSNHSHYTVGIIRPPVIGPKIDVAYAQDMRLSVFMMYAGLLVAVGLYTMLLAFWHAGETYYYVGCFVLLISAARLLFVETYIWLFFPDMAFTTILRLEYMTFFVFPAGLYGVAAGLYPAESSRFGMIAFIILGIAGWLVAAFAPMSFLFAVRDPFVLVTGVAWVMTVALFLRAKSNGREGAGVAVAGLLIVAFSMIRDYMMYLTGRPYGAETAPLAALTFALILIWLFTVRYRHEQREREALSRYLEKANADLSARAAELDIAHGQAGAALEMKSSFLANISHEVRTPLNAIIGFSDLLISQSHAPADGEKQREYLRLIRNNGQNLLTLMTDILSVSDLEAGRFDIALASINPRDVVEMSVGFIGPAAHEKHLFLDVSCESINMQADERLMRQTVIKILSNAVKYSPAHGVVTVRGRVLADQYSLSVIDTGSGIEDKDLPTALSLFGRVGSAYTASKAGLGLGLPLVSRFMALMGGTMNIDSIADVGTTVTLSFPLSPPVPADRPDTI